jgi:MFS family permease
VLWWSLFTICTGLATGFIVLLFCRFLFGAGEAGAYPNAAGSIGRWFPDAERARAQGFVWGASRLGGTLTPLLVVPLMMQFGWRSIFYVFGSLGLVWIAVWYTWYRDHPSEHRSITPEELAEVETTQNRSASRSVRGTPWGALFRSRQLWLIMAMYWCYVWGSMFYLTWFPEYLMKGRGLTEAQMGMFSALPFFFGAAGNLIGGFLSDGLSRRFGLSVGRRFLGAACLAASGLLLLATAVTPGKATAIALLAVGFGVMDCMLPSAWAICLDVGGRHAGAVSGAMNSAGQAGGFVCTVLFGHLVGAGHGYDAALAVIAVMVLISAGLFLCIDPTRPLVPEENAVQAHEVS